MNHLAAADQRRISYHAVESGFDATYAGEGGRWNSDKKKECVNEPHVFLDGNCSRDNRKTQLTPAPRVYLSRTPAPIYICGQ